MMQKILRVLITLQQYTFHKRL